MNSPNPIRVERSKCGAPSLRVEDRWWHSAYDPRQEAARFAQKASVGSDPRTILLLGDGLGYGTDALAQRFPRAVVRGVSLADTIAAVPPARFGARVGGVRWNGPATLNAILPTLHPVHAARLEVAVWPTLHADHSDFCRSLLEDQRALATLLVRTLQSELATVASFGRQWLRRAVDSTCFLAERFIPDPVGTGLAVAAAGPSLTTSALALPTLAVSSAIAPLEAHRIGPIGVVHTDSGYWASRFLSHAFRGSALQAGAPPLFALLRAARPWHGPTCLLSCGWFADHLAIDATEWLRVSEQPSVTLTALDLAQQLRATQIHVLGLDLCSYDLLDHALPHLHYTWRLARASRLRPLLTEQFAAVVAPATRRLRWHDETIGYQSPSMHSFSQAVNSKAAIPLSFGGNSPVRSGPNSSAPDPTTKATGAEPARALTGRQVVRPARRQRVSHAIGVLHSWYHTDISLESDALWGVAADLALHAAPVALLQAIRSTPSDDPALAAQSVRSVVQRVINDLIARAERWNGDD